MSLGWVVVTVAELAEAGLDERSIRAACRSGRLTRLGRGVYLDGPRLAGVEGWQQDLHGAALLHPQAVIAGAAAAAVYELDGFEPPQPIRLQAPRPTSSTSPAVRRRRALQPPNTIGRLVVASVEDTLLGLGEDLAPRPGCAAAPAPLDAELLVELAVEAALRRGLTTLERLTDAVAATDARRPGREVLRRVLAARPAEPPTGSYLETRCHQVLRAAGLPALHRQVELRDTGGRIGIVDFALGPVVIEVVGRRWHLERFDPDHRRYARLVAAGNRLLTFTFEDIEHRPDHVVDATRRALARAPLC